MPAIASGVVLCWRTYDLTHEVADGCCREDLYAELNVIALNLPL